MRGPRGSVSPSLTRNRTRGPGGGDVVSSLMPTKVEAHRGSGVRRSLTADEKHRSGRARQPQPRRRAAALRRLQPDLAVRLAYGPCRDRQPQPGPGQATRGRRAPEPVEDVGQVLGRDARSLVPYGQLTLLEVYGHGPAGRAELHRVVQEVDEGPLQRRGVAAHVPGRDIGL